MPKKQKKVSMSKKSFKKEHKKLVKVLKHGSKKARVKEAKKQQKELKQKSDTFQILNYDTFQKLN